MENYLKGAFDLHLHTSPDRVERKLSDHEMAQRAVAREMRGFVIKNHYEDTSLRAAAICRAFPKLLVAGGITLNDSVGGISAQAVETAAAHGAKFVWFPTMDAAHWNSFYGKETAKAIQILREGKLIPEVYDVLDVIKAHHMVLGTGHVSPVESLALVKAAHSRGIEKIVLTHADAPSVFTDAQQQLEFVRQGAVIEHSTLSLEMGKTSWKIMMEQINTVGCEHIVVSSDLGQPENPYPDDSLNQFVQGLVERGISEVGIEKMVRDLPSWLMC